MSHNVIKHRLHIGTVLLSSIIVASCSSSGSNSSATKPTSSQQPTAPDTSTAKVSKNGMSGVQHISLKIFGIRSTNTTRDFDITDTSVQGMANKASEQVTAPVNITVKGKSDSNVKNGFKLHNNNTVTKTVVGDANLPYKSVYKTFDNGTLNIVHVNGTAKAKAVSVPVDAVGAFGKATTIANVPSTGKAQYKGDATYRKNGAGNSVEFGTSQFAVDFVSKKVDGNLTFTKAGNINIDANIKGNTFSGYQGGYEADGGFYGDKAQLLGGIYEGKNAQGTYGAKK